MKSVRTLLVALLLMPLGVRHIAAARSQPNVVLILADDLGWSDVGCYGGDLVEQTDIA